MRLPNKASQRVWLLTASPGVIGSTCRAMRSGQNSGGFCVATRLLKEEIELHVSSRGSRGLLNSGLRFFYSPAFIRFHVGRPTDSRCIASRGAGCL